MRPYLVGLTGGIGSGKTAVSNLFAELGAEVIDADVISRSLVEPGQPVLAKLAALAPEPVLLPDGSLDRARLRKLIFQDPGLKQAVDQLLHPMVRREIEQRISRSQSPLIILVVPLLLENRAYEFVDRVLVVDAPEALQISRTVARDNTTAQDVERIMRHQLDRETRLQGADDVICNDGDLAQLRQRVMELHGRYKTLAGEHP